MMRWQVWLVAVTALVVLPTAALARGTFLSTWQGQYGSSSSDDNVINGTGKSCQLCHSDVNGGDGWNGYGWDLWLRMDAGDSIAQAIAAVESFDSDLDVSGTWTNLEEINADAQPGWTLGAVNDLFFKDGSVVTGQMPPSAILGNLDPVALEPDINLNPSTLMFGTVAIGNSPTLGAAIENLGDADLQVTGISLCAGTSAEYSWSPSPPLTISAGGNTVLSVTYTPVDEGDDFGCLDLSSNDPDEPTAQLNVEGTGSGPDSDGDTIPDSSDNCPLTANAGQENSDGDTRGDACDNCLVVNNDGPNPRPGNGAPQCDDDTDGYGNHCDCDFNQDGACNAVDVSTITLNFNQSVIAGISDVADSNCDGNVNAVDVSNLTLHFNQLMAASPKLSGLACADATLARPGMCF